MPNYVSRFVACLLIAGLLLQVAPAPAALVPTDEVLATQTNEQREHIQAFLNRQDVQTQLQQYGVSPDEAKARVNALTDDEAGNLAGKLDSLPAGGVIGEIIGAALIVFIVLLITDILGFTKVFSFTRPVKK
jgi:hypothetical protein